MQSFWSIWVALLSMTCPYKGHTEKKEGDVNTEAEMGVTHFIPVTDYTCQ